MQSGRIEELKEFYSASELAASLKSLGFEDQVKGKSTDELRGKLVIEQLKKVAETLRVWPFVCPEEELGTKYMPEIEGMEDYLEVETLKERTHLVELDRRIDTYGERAEDLYGRYESAKAKAKSLKLSKPQKASIQETEIDGKSISEGKAAATRSKKPKEAENEDFEPDQDSIIEEACAEVETLYQKWEAADDILSRRVNEKKKDIVGGREQSTVTLRR